VLQVAWCRTYWDTEPKKTPTTSLWPRVPTTSAYHECTGSLTESSECRPRGVEHSLALDDDRGLKVLGQAGCVRNDGLGRFMDEALWNDEAGAPCRGHHLLRTHDVERYVPSGRLSDSELDGAVAQTVRRRPRRFEGRLRLWQPAHSVPLQPPRGLGDFSSIVLARRPLA
jgi:hypothetical protein